MLRTPLHVALGVSDADLSFEIIERACADGVTERADLDWKASLPLTATDAAAKREQQAELAKDIAAMANSGGGMIVFGIDERRGADTSAADEIRPVGAVTETTQHQIRQVASNLIYPPVTSLVIRPIAPTADPDAGVLVLVVPGSPEAPHLIHPRGNRDWFAAPWRDGAHTTYMVERQLDLAYRQREVARRQRGSDVDALYASFARACSSTSGTWVIAVAHPDVPHRRDRDLTRSRADQIFTACGWSNHGEFIGPLEEIRQSSTRRGLRSFHRASKRGAQPAGASISARVEIRGNGAVAVGFCRGGAFYGDDAADSRQVSIGDFDQVGVDLTHLLLATMRGLGLATDYTAQVGIYPSSQLFRRPDGGQRGLFQPFVEEHRVHHFDDVYGPILTGEGVEVTFASTIEVVRDAVNQGDWETRLSAADLATQWLLDN